jgi:hypothetical protein
LQLGNLSLPPSPCCTSVVASSHIGLALHLLTVFFGANSTAARAVNFEKNRPIDADSP